MTTRRSLRLPEVEKKTGLKKTQILDAVEKGTFPSPFKILPEGRAIGWDEGEIDEHLAHQMAKRTKEVV
jgi:predicted DNA-binding transcriptional regulator AlpA